MKHKKISEILIKWIDLDDLKNAFLKKSKDGEINFLNTYKSIFIPL